ncbi:hypothetical protein E4T80_09890 [Muribacter muris]|uniref:Uncharacterized protein n=1 Tax=Muribacter muris TaxID=67855 RepID=A0A4Y9JSA6_9PAST|nr:hypothetical protein [Muribacter muris]MBF0785769.1 hypothetical protein [Muribacter muris]MBF0828259.1 hypothetical protein [Muribacter muris]TFV08591.1 hypothetical protein E4T80_09890 [Muribacter muris]
MATLKPTANAKHKVNAQTGFGQNGQVRFRDSTASVGGQMFGGSMTNKTGQKPTNCSDCSR